MDQMILQLRATLSAMYNFDDRVLTIPEIILLLIEVRSELPEIFAEACEEPEFVVCIFRAVIDYEIVRYTKELTTTV